MPPSNSPEKNRTQLTKLSPYYSCVTTPVYICSFAQCDVPREFRYFGERSAHRDRIYSRSWLVGHGATTPAHPLQRGTPLSSRRNTTMWGRQTRETYWSVVHCRVPTGVIPQFLYVYIHLCIVITASLFSFSTWITRKPPVRSPFIPDICTHIPDSPAILLFERFVSISYNIHFLTSSPYSHFWNLSLTFFFSLKAARNSTYI